ncbi:helix-turn-helix domain-containing protein [Brevundimonas diminuta]
MSNELRDQTAQIIRSIMEQQGWSASQTAREAGLSPSTLTRALDEDSPFTPSSATLQKLMQLALKMRNESADEYWSTLDDVSRTATRLALVTGEPIPVAGAVEWGAWRDTLLQKPQTGRSISLFDSSWLSKSIAIYEVADDVSDPSYKAGSFLVVGSHKEETIYDQDVFLCRRIVSFFGGSKYQLSLWEYRPSSEGEGRELVCRALPAQDFDPDAAGDEEKAHRYQFEILGVVLASYQPREARMRQPRPMPTPFDD